MSSTYSPILRTELIGAGDQPGTWGTSTNSNFQYIFETAIAGYQAVTVSPTTNNQVLTYVNGPSATPSLNQSIYAVLKLNAGTLGANFNIFTPPASKTYIIWNNTSYTATFYNSSIIGNTTAAGSGVVVPVGAKVAIWSDGTNFFSIDTSTGNFNVVGNELVGGTLGVTGATALTTGAISGIITAPTAAAGTNTTQLATTAFVTTAVASAFPSGTRVPFAQASAPTGWTQDTSDNATNRMLRVVAGTGNGIGGSASPILNNVVPSHTHTVSSSGTTSTVDINHTHGFSGSGTTSGQSVDHSHAASVSDPGHAHASPKNAAPNGGGAGVCMADASGGNSPGYATTSASTGITVTNGGVSVDHNHTVSISGTSATMNSNNTHNHTVTVSGTTAANGSASDWTPRYIDLIICAKN